MYLESIKSPADLKKLSLAEQQYLAGEIRQRILSTVSRTGGHLASSLGTVELTLALHSVFDCPQDKIVWDVGHQAYTHKIITGRNARFDTLRQENGLSGFPKQKESPYDAYLGGHSGVSISAALGMAEAMRLHGEEGFAIAVIGDGSFGSGVAYEGMNNAGRSGEKIIIVLNDNDMSIAENHGGLYGNLKLLRETNGQAECNLFKAMGLDYIYVDHGNAVGDLIEAFQSVKDSRKPVVVHINTLKGKGYAPAEQNKEVWHYNGPFHIETGEPLYEMTEEDYSDISLNYLLDKMKKDPAVVAITSGTPTVMGFTEDKRKEAGKQFVDVGIAEETAVALASGIAANGGKPVYGVYSTFVQRTYDQITQDLCIDSNAATIVTFWGSVYGMNDVTHLGLQDIPMMSNIPNLVYLAPTTKEEYLAMLDWSIDQDQYPVAIKLPGGEMISDSKKITKDFSQLNKYEVTEKGSKVAVIGLGTFYNMGCEVAKAVEEKTGTKATVINPYYITGIDEALLEGLKKDHDVVITLEDGFLEGGFGEKITRFYGNSDMKVLNYGVKKELLDRYNVKELLKKNRLTVEQIVEDL